jgi:hypothetical protein
MTDLLPLDNNAYQEDLDVVDPEFAAAIEQSRAEAFSGEHHRGQASGSMASDVYSRSQEEGELAHC